MNIRAWWHDRQGKKAQRFLRDHPGLALHALRQSPEMSIAAVNAYMAEQAARAGDPSDRKTAPWPILQQLGHGARRAVTQTLPKVSPFNLRKFSEYPPARRAINAITNPIVELAWEIRKRPDPRQPAYLQETTEEERLAIEIAKTCLEKPNNDDSWRTLLETTLEDLVVGGYGALEIRQHTDPLRPAIVYPVDGQSIRINAAWKGDPAEPRYSQALAYVGMSVGTHDRVELLDDELIYLRLNPRANTPFGLGYLEVAFGVINAWIGSLEYAERRASNEVPNFGLFLGEHVDIATARRWRAYWQEQIEGYGQIPILGGGAKPEVLSFQGTGQDQLFIAWNEHLIRLIAIAFGISPSTIGLERDVNRSTAEVQNIADWDAIRPVMGTVADYLTRRLLWRALGYTSLEFAWIVKDADELRQAQIMREKYEMNALTIDEIREVDGKEPLPDGSGQLTKSQYEAYVQAQYAPAMPEIGGPPMLGEEGRWRDDRLELPVPVREDGAPDDVDELLERAREAVSFAGTNGHGGF